MSASSVTDLCKQKTQMLATKEDLIQASILELKINEMKNDMIKWMVALWCMLVLMIIGIYLK